MSQVKKSGRIVSRVDLASLLAVSLPTIDAYVRRGCPFVARGSKGKEWQFDTAAVIEWLRDSAVADATAATKDVSFDEARRQDVAASAQIKQYELAKLRRTMVAIDEIEERLTEEYAAAKSRLVAIPGRVAQKLVAATDPAEV